jgi:hypothetical protein
MNAAATTTPSHTGGEVGRTTSASSRVVSGLGSGAGGGTDAKF